MHLVCFLLEFVHVLGGGDVELLLPLSQLHHLSGRHLLCVKGLRDLCNFVQAFGIMITELRDEVRQVGHQLASGTLVCVCAGWFGELLGEDFEKVIWLLAREVASGETG